MISIFKSVENMLINGIDLADRYQSSAGGYFVVNDVRGRGVYPVELIQTDVPGRPGSYITGRKIEPRVLEIDITLKGDDYRDLREKIEDLISLLQTDEELTIQFEDEPDRMYFGRLEQVDHRLEKSKIYQATLYFVCQDPYKYGPLRTQTIAVPPASFSRNSVAYLSDGTQVAVNQPRFEQGGILIEEGTTNLIPSALAKNLTSAWTSGTLNGTYTLSVRGGTGQVNISGGYTGSVAVGQTLTFNVSNAAITLTPADGTPQFVQLEQKPYATSFIDGTRQPENLTLPKDGVLFDDEGTIEIELSANLNSQNTNIFNGHDLVWFDENQGSTPSKGFILRRVQNNIQLVISKNGSITSVSYPKTWNSGSRFIFAVKWDQNNIFAYMNGTKVLTLQKFDIPSSNILRIGSRSLSSQYSGNAIYQNIRISRIARSDAEILDTYQNGFKVDEYTTAYLPFDGDLNVQTPTIVTNDGTAETYPTFTAYVQQPITFLDIISPDSYMRVGQPYSVDQMPVDGDQPVMQDEMGTLTGWGAGSGVVDGIIQGSFQSDGNKFTVKDYGPAYDGWAGPALKKSLPSQLQDFRVHALIDIKSSTNGVGRIEVYGLDAANNIVFRMTIGDFSAKTKDVKAFWGLGPSADNIFTTYGKKTGSLNDYYGSLVVERKGNIWRVYTAKRTGPTNQDGTYIDYVEQKFVDTKNQYTAKLAQIQVHIGSHLKYTPIDQMSINHVFVYDLHDPSTDQVPYIAYPGDVLQFDHKAACIYKNGDIFMSAKDFGASFFLLGKGETELAVNPNDAAIVTVDYRPRWY